ncbi:hypothetical protein MNBD_PLANCTO03-2328 [hydrothermal vent metagenome]|uniref:Cytochrome c domain-containing protein n=1 Tax=hydrothermal vent metagenome TaxID=652676 RepID=A0A3B1E7H6_9ZZZZ
MATNALKLRDFGFGVRLGLTLLAFVILGGSAVSGLYLRAHHDNRDEREGFTLDDIRAHYHGIQSKSPMLGALERSHPEDLDTDQRQVLIDWLTSDRVREDYDNFDLGENMPEEIIAVSCVSCHDSGATGAEAYPELSLRYFDDVMANAVSREIKPVSLEVLTASLHAHSLALGTMCLVMVLLVALTRAPRSVVGVLAVMIGAGLLADLGSWIPARQNAAFIYGIVGGGLLFQIGVVLSLVIVVLDLWLPRKAQ